MLYNRIDSGFCARSLQHFVDEGWLPKLEIYIENYSYKKLNKIVNNKSNTQFKCTTLSTKELSNVTHFTNIMIFFYK